jgi:pimeloyl-ACP methyl ester carboxylesterase
LWPLQPAGIEFWLVPRANHYLQLDQPKEFVEVISAAFAGNILAAPGPLSEAPGAPLVV